MDYEIFELVGRKRGFLISGGEINTERTAATLLEEFRSAKIGAISIEIPQ
jgi:ribosome biogenesis GTPase A